MLGTNHVLENSQKLPPRVVQPPGASMLTYGWVRTVRTAQNLHNADIQWAERAVEADFVEPKLCIPGRLNQTVATEHLLRSYAMAYARQWARNGD